MTLWYVLVNTVLLGQVEGADPGKLCLHWSKLHPLKRNVRLWQSNSLMSWMLSPHLQTCIILQLALNSRPTLLIFNLV